MRGMHGHPAFLCLRKGRRGQHDVLPAIRTGRRTGDESGLVGGDKDDAADDPFRLAETCRDPRNDLGIRHLRRYGADHLRADTGARDDARGAALEGVSCATATCSPHASLMPALFLTVQDLTPELVRQFGAIYISLWTLLVEDTVASPIREVP